MELFRALAVLCEPPSPAHRRVARALRLPAIPSSADYADLFLFQLYPYASVYAGPEGMLGGEARDRVAGFWRALGRIPPAEPDHLAALLGLYATLAEAEEGESEAAAGLLRREARRALLSEHLLAWLPPFLAKAREIGPPVYRCWAELLHEALRGEAEALGPQPSLPLHLRQAPPLQPPEATGGREFLAALLAPARSGIILVRSDLARAARGLGLGLRAGERRFVLESLLSQEPRATLAWLAGEAEAWEGRHARETWLGAVSQFWRERAGAAAALLSEAAAVSEKEVARA